MAQHDAEEPVKRKTATTVQVFKDCVLLIAALVKLVQILTDWFV